MKRSLLLLATGMLLALLYHVHAVNRAVIEFDLVTDKKDILKVYWPREDGRFSEQDMAQVRISPQHHHYAMRICNIEDIDFLRIDPSEDINRVILRNIVIRQQGYPPLVWDSPRALAQLYPLAQIGLMQEVANGLAVISAGRDPQLHLPLIKPPRDLKLSLTLLRSAVIVLLFHGLAWAVSPLLDGYRLVPALLFSACVLALCMAVLSRDNSHPDEFVHVRAAEYYQDHVLPPRIEDPAIAPTYSIYGSSRLNSGEIVYLFAGTFLRLLAPLHADPYMVLRTFNISLLCILMFLAVRLPRYRLLLLPLLISPQIWYIYSYFNSDGLALFMLLLLACQAVEPRSSFNRLVREGLSGSRLLRLIPLALLIGLSMQVKMNYYFFHLFLVLYCIWRLVFQDPPPWRTRLRRMLVIALAGLALAGLFRAPHYLVNGPDRAAKLAAAQHRYADEQHNYATPPGRRHVYFTMHERGATLAELIQLEFFFEKSFESAFGVYGYTTVLGSFAYYDLVRRVCLAVLGLLCACVLLRGGLPGVTLLLLLLGTTAALAGVSLHHSWYVDFQAQGRYFLCVAAMLGMFLYHYARTIPRPLLYTALLSLYTLGVYSFVFVGLPGIARLTLAAS